MEMKNPPPTMTEKMPTTKPPPRSSAVSRVRSQGAIALIHERSITVLHLPNAAGTSNIVYPPRYDQPTPAAPPAREACPHKELPVTLQFRRVKINPFPHLLQWQIYHS